MLTSLSEAKTLCRRAALILQDWPAQLNELLETMQARSSGAGSLSLKRTFGLLYPYWLNSRNSVELGFFSRAFENWIQEHWTGLVRGQNTALSSNMRAQPRWIPAPEGAKQANLVVRQIRELIQRGEIKGILISPSGTGRRECWIDRQSLADWIARRDRALSTCMNAKNVGFALGLSSLTLKTIAAAGVIREVQAWEKWFAGDGPYYERSDVEAIQKAFAGQNGDASGPSEAKNLITLQHAVRLYLGRQRLPLIIEAVKSGQLIPTGKAEGSARLGGYLFVKAEIAAYSPPRRVSAIPDDLMDCGHAAEILQTNSEVVRNLARNRKFFSPPVLLHGRKLIRKAEVERFSLAFVALAQVARQCATSSRAMVSGMARRGVKILAVRLPGKGLKLFIPRTAAEFIGRLEPISGARGSGKRAQ
jgi:hypothetical protein